MRDIKKGAHLAERAPFRETENKPPVPKLEQSFEVG